MYVCVHVPCGSRVLDWRYGVMDVMHACNDANVYNKHRSAYMYENVCAYLLYAHLHFGVYQMRDETWLARIGLHFPITCTSFKSGRAFRS